YSASMKFKKTFITALSTIALLAIICFFELRSRTSQPPLYCAFCDKKVLTAQTFYEGEHVLALYTNRPIYAGHCLIIPKRHVSRFENLSNAEITEIGAVIKKVDKAVTTVFGNTDYLLLQKNGPAAGQN